MMTDYVTTATLRFIERLEPESGRALRILQQQWIESRAFLDTRPAQTEWRDVPCVKADGT